MRRTLICSLLLVLSAGCTSGGAPAPAAPDEVVETRGDLDHLDEGSELELAPGRLSCHDKDGDVLSEGSGDQSGPAPTPPDPAQPGSDLTGVSMSRYESGMTINFGTAGRVPSDLPRRSRLYYTFSVVPVKDEGNRVAVMSAIFRHGRWVIEVRQDKRYEVLEQRPEVAGHVLAMDLTASEIPELMRRAFRWRAHTEWIPRPTDTASQIYFDYCPDQGFPIFRGTST